MFSAAYPCTLDGTALSWLTSKPSWWIGDCLMEGENVATANAEAPGAAQSRQRSTIGFPYMDLNASVDLAEAIHGHVGHGDCDDDQLAAWTNQSAKSSGFRTQVYAARMFGVLDGESGRHRLTDLGRAVVDPNQAREARARAFLNVPLYRAVFENHRGGVLPPAAALEREMVGLGVAEKQKDRARQVFERAADQAGFFEHGRNRLVAPGVQRGETPPPDDKGKGGGGGGNGGGNGGGSEPDPVVKALIDKLPKQGPWPVEERVMWLQMISMAFQMAYGKEPPITITKGPDIMA